jgi:hypothetical protein
MERKARTKPAQLRGLESKKKSGRWGDLFLDFPLYRTYQALCAVCGMESLIVTRLLTPSLEQHP